MTNGVIGKLLQRIGVHYPYPQSPLGVIQEGTGADILLIEGNLVEYLLRLMVKNYILLIIKDRGIYKKVT